MTEHVILVAFEVEDDSRENAMRRLREVLPRPTGEVVESWWVA